MSLGDQLSRHFCYNVAFLNGSKLFTEMYKVNQAMYILDTIFDSNNITLAQGILKNLFTIVHRFV